MATSTATVGENLQEFVDLLSDLRGVVEVRVLTEANEAWVGFRTLQDRPAAPLLEQVTKAAIGFGLDARAVHFGILVD